MPAQALAGQRRQSSRGYPARAIAGRRRVSWLPAGAPRGYGGQAQPAPRLDNAPRREQGEVGKGLAGALLRAVVLEVHLGGLAVLDGDFLGLGAVLLVPGLERVLAGRNVGDLERAVSAGNRLVRVLGNADVPAHPWMHVAL